MGHLSGVCRFVYSVRLSIVELSYAFVHNLRSYSLHLIAGKEGVLSSPSPSPKKKKKMPDGMLRFFPLHELITCLNCAGCRMKPKRQSAGTKISVYVLTCERFLLAGLSKPLVLTCERFFLAGLSKPLIFR